MKIIKNYIYNLTYQILAIIVPIIITPYISRILGVEGVGKYSVSYGITNYFVLFGMLGIAMYGSREIAYVRNDEDALYRTFWEINFLKFITMGLSLVLFLLFLTCFVDTELKILYYMQFLILSASFFDITWYFIGIENFKKIAIRNIVIKIVGVMLIFVFVNDCDDLFLYAGILSTTLLIGQILLWFDIFFKVKFIMPTINGIKKHFYQTAHLWIPTIAVNVYTSLDKVMLGYLTDNVQAGLYESSQKIVKIATTINTSLAIVTLPSVSNAYINKDKIKFNKLITNSFAMVTFIAFPLAAGIIAIRFSFVPWFFGKGYEDVVSLLAISSYLVVTLSWSSIFGKQILISCGEEKKYTFAVTSGAIINIILNVIFIKHFKAKGAIYSSVIAEYVGMLIMVFYSRKHIPVSSLFRIVPKYLLSSIVMFVPVFYFGQILRKNFVTTIFQVLLGCCLYVAIMIVTRDSIYIYGRKILCQLFIKTKKS